MEQDSRRYRVIVVRPDGMKLLIRQYIGISTAREIEAALEVYLPSRLRKAEILVVEDSDLSSKGRRRAVLPAAGVDLRHARGPRPDRGIGARRRP